MSGGVLERILECSGYTCSLAENGRLALEALERGPYGCILMDCQMPVMDGYEATRTIRRNETTTGDHIPIIAVIANALAEDRDRCLDAGMDEYIEKPVRRQELVEALERHLGVTAAAG